MDYCSQEAWQQGFLVCLRWVRCVHAHLHCLFFTHPCVSQHFSVGSILQIQAVTLSDGDKIMDLFNQWALHNIECLAELISSYKASLHT